MENLQTTSDQNSGSILERLQVVEHKLSKIESLLSTTNIHIPYTRREDVTEEIAPLFKEGSFLESGIFEHGLAWLGSIILSFGMIFLISLGNNLGGNIISLFTGLALAGFVLWLAHYLRKTFSNMSFTFKLSGYFLIFYTLIKLHFYNPKALVTSLWVEAALLIIFLIFLLYEAYRKDSQIYGFFAFIMTILTSIIINNAIFSPAILAISALASLFYFWKKGWSPLFISAMFIIYLIQLNFLLGNPIINQPPHIIGSPASNLAFLMVYGAIFSSFPVLKNTFNKSDEFFSIAIVINGFNFSLALIILTFLYFPESYSAYFLWISMICIAYSIYLFFKSSRKFDSAFYACFSFMAVSVAIFGYAKLPGSLLYLSLQSFVVLSFAIWYRSRIILITNTFLYISLLIANLFIGGGNLINYTFVIVALTSAWIILWQKERLTLKLSFVHDLYLCLTFFTLLYALVVALPREYIAMSWAFTAVFYMSLSLFLKRKIYRWLAILSFICTVFYLFIVDLAKMNTLFRMIAFLFLALVIIGVSVFYSKKLKKSGDEATE